MRAQCGEPQHDDQRDGNLLWRPFAEGTFVEDLRTAADEHDRHLPGTDRDRYAWVHTRFLLVAGRQARAHAR